MTREKKVTAPTMVDFKMTRVRIAVRGLTELIMDQWTEAAIDAIVKGQAGAVKILVPREPEEEYKLSIYRDMNGAVVIPEKNIKACLTDAGRAFPSIHMTDLRQMLRVNSVAYVDGEHRMRTDPVRLNGRKWSVAHRAGFPEWKTVLDFSFLGIVLSEDIVLNIARAAGMVGLCAWRPGKSNSGWAGTFEVDTERMDAMTVEQVGG